MSDILITLPAEPEWALQVTGLDPAAYPEGLAGWARFVPDDGSPPTNTGLGDAMVRPNGATPPFQESQVALMGGDTSKKGLLTMWVSKAAPGGPGFYNPPIEITSGPAVVARRVP